MSSSLCSTSCSMPLTTFSATLTGGIQDVSALLPLLGTEQCEEHVSSALTNGYLYAAASPMSLFGSLGLARAGFKTLLASVNISIRKWNFNGATMLSNMGFQPQGENLSLIMADTGQKGRYVVESRLDSLLEELHLDETQIRDVLHKTKTWNIAMVTLTGLFSSMSMLPYVYLNTRAGSSLPALTRWSFPALRAVGGFLISTTMQLTLQRRITTITRNWLSERIRRRRSDRVGREQPETAEEDEKLLDAEKGLEDTGPKVYTTDRLTWVLLVLLWLGEIATVVGYIGCFSVVQGARSSSGPLSWLCFEVGLSLVRIILWGLNPKMDDAPPLEFILKLNDDPPLPTCTRSDDQIWKDKVLPLTRASRFLNSITSFAGLVKHFDRPGLTLYYTLTRAGPNPQPKENELQRSAYERTLYITIFDHKERTTRVFTRNGPFSHFYSADVPDVDLEHGLLEAKLGKKIDSKNDPIVGDGDIQKLLVEHHQSLMCSTLSHPTRSKHYRIANTWTMKGRGDKLVPDKEVHVGDDEDDCLARDRRYLEQGQFEEMRRLLDVKRGEWIETYMRQVIAETRERFQVQKGSIREVDEVLADEENTGGKETETSGEEVVKRESHQTTADNNNESEVVECWLIAERRFMELLLVYEVEEWEEKLWKVTEEFIRTDEVQEKEREWKAKCWQRFDANIRAMNERMEAAKTNVKGSSNDLSRAWQGAHRDIQKTWQSAVKRFVDGSPSRSIISCRDRLEEDFRINAHRMSFMSWWQKPEQKLRLRQQMESRLRKELDDIEFRLGQGLEKSDHFWGSDEVFKVRHSRAKWLDMFHLRWSDPAELEFYSRTLKTRNDILYVNFLDCDVNWVIETIRDLPSLNSVLFHTGSRLRDIQRDPPLFVDTSDTSISTFLRDNQLSLAGTHHTFIFISNEGIIPNFRSTEIELHRPTLAISFFGPSSGSLTLRLKHHSSRPDANLRLTVTGFPTSTFKLPIPSLLATSDIALHSHPSESPSFTPDSRNIMLIQLEGCLFQQYWLQDIQLLDEAGDPYNPRPSEISDLSQVPPICNFAIPTLPSFPEAETPSNSPVSLLSQRAKSEIDDISEGSEGCQGNP